MKKISSGRILIVEYEHSVRAVLRRALERRDHQVETVIDGWDAIAQLERETFAIILMDLITPRTSGYEVLAFLAQHDIATPVILLTHPDDRFVARVATEAVLAILRKPIDVDLLADAASAVCIAMHPQRSDRRAGRDAPAADEARA